MNDAVLYLRMTLRRRVTICLIVLFTAAITVFLLLYPQIIRRARLEMQNASGSVLVFARVQNASGFGEPNIPYPVYGKVKACNLLDQRLAVARTDVDMTTREIMEALYSEYAPDDPALAEKYAQDRTKQAEEDEGLKMGGVRKYNTDAGILSGISSLSISGDLQKKADSIRWLAGYDESCLQGAEKVALVADSAGYELGDILTVATLVTKTKYLPLQLKVVGLLPESPNATAYCPVDGLRAAYIQQGREGSFFLQSLYFTLEDNWQFPAFKNFLKNLTDNSEDLKVYLDDSRFQNTVGPLQSNLQMLEKLFPALFGAVALIGFFLCFLLARRRRQEFAVMRLLGEKAGQITGKAVLEQAILCAIGVVLGSLIVMVSGLGQFSSLTCGGVLLCYSIGSALAVMLMVRVNVMEILREKE